MCGLTHKMDSRNQKMCMWPWTLSVPGVHVQAAEDDVSQELQFSSPSEAFVGFRNQKLSAPLGNPEPIGGHPATRYTIFGLHSHYWHRHLLMNCEKMSLQPFIHLNGCTTSFWWFPVWLILWLLKMKAMCSSELSSFLYDTQRCNPGDSSVYSHDHENLRSNIYV